MPGRSAIEKANHGWPSDEDVIKWLMVQFDKTHESYYIYAAGKLTSAISANRYLEKLVNE